MFTELSRRMVLKVLAAGSSLLGKTEVATASERQIAPKRYPVIGQVGNWHKTSDRVFLGGEFWANPMENWQIVDGGAEVHSKAGDRNIHLLTHQLTNAKGTIDMSVVIRALEVGSNDGGAGFRIGVRSEINEYRSNCFAKNGVVVGVIDGTLKVGNKSAKLEEFDATQPFNLRVEGKPDGDKYQLTATVGSIRTGKDVGSVTASVPATAIDGNVAIVSNFDSKLRGGQGSRYRFSEWRVEGDAFTAKPEQKFGPLLWTMYTLSNSGSDKKYIMRLSAFTGPLGKDDNKDLTLEVKKEGDWTEIASATLDEDAWTAIFDVPNWDETTATPYRVVYKERHSDDSVSTHQHEGIIRANPSGRPLRLAALTCQNDYAFPYEPVANNLVKMDPDMLYFSGDQLYENHGGYGIIRDPAPPAILNYLRKFYQFGWSFRESLANAPSVCIPDDHDVFQGNIWGEGGAAMKGIAKGASSKGGYREPARMVNVVHRTCTGHHPKPYDPEPCLQDISVYYGTLVYGNVSFAILGDRQWKSGPERVETGSGRADHVLDPKFDTSVLDKEGLVLLGERQEKFLEAWSNDWENHTVKVLLSQTVFAGVATHHGGYNGYLKADLDSGAWPQTARNRTIDLLRPSMALHINGDQHLTTLSQYGVDAQRDSNWSFCTPAIAAGYPRWWRPDECGMEHENRPKHGLDNTGEYIDGFGNKVYVYAVGNPEVGTERNRYDKAHQKGSGFGFVTIDTKAKTYHIESFRFLIDPTDGKPENQFPGWPVTLQQKENGGQNVIG